MLLLLVSRYDFKKNVWFGLSFLKRGSFVAGRGVFPFKTIKNYRQYWESPALSITYPNTQWGDCIFTNAWVFFIFWGIDVGIKIWLVVSTHLKNISQNWKSSPNRGEHRKCMKPPPRNRPTIHEECLGTRICFLVKFAWSFIVFHGMQTNHHWSHQLWPECLCIWYPNTQCILPTFAMNIQGVVGKKNKYIYI